MASINDLYLEILGRPADPGGKQFYEQQLASGAKTLSQIAADLQYAVDTGLEKKAKNQAATQAVQQAYVAELGRPADVQGLGFYTAKAINEGIASVVGDLSYAAATGVENKATNITQYSNVPPTTILGLEDTTTTGGGTTGGGTTGGGTTGGGTTGGGTTGGGTTGGGTTGVDPNRVQAVTDLYRTIFYRAPDATGLAFYTTGGGKDVPINELAGVLRNEPEGRQVANVANLYTTYLGRAPDAGGVRNFVDRFGDTIDDQELFYFLDTGRLNNENVSQAGLDFITNYTGPRDFTGIDPGFRKQAVSDLFRNVFYRDPDQAGLEFYTTGGGKDIPLDQLRQTFLASPEGVQVTNVASMYKDYFGRDPDPEGLRYYYDMFGATIDPSERFFFLDAARQQGIETLSQDALDFLSSYQPPPPGDDTQPPPITGTPLTFEPLQRGLAQLRPAAFMPGLLKGDPGFGGSGFTPEQLRAANAGLSAADRAYLMDVGGVSPAELAAATGTPMGQLQGEYNQNRPGGLFFTGPNQPRGLPEDFVLQTGANLPPIVPISPLTGLPYAEPRENIDAVVDEVNAPIIVNRRAGGVINYQEGGDVEPTTPPPMPKLSAAEAGSKFDISEFIDEQGRLVGGYSRPVYDENQVIVGYEYTPYERDVVLNPRLREAQARTLDTEQAMLDMLARQGRTGVSPTMGGLPGIMAREAMMRNMPQYYSTIEAGRRYRGMAKGGLASVAQDLADKGRFGDTMVAHISPQEAMMLKAMGGSGTINPETGLPEFFLDKIFGRGKLIDINIGKKSQQALAAAAGIASGLGFIPSFIPGLGAVASTGLIAGGIGALGNRSLSAGLQLGLSAYGAGKGTEVISNLMADPSVTANAASSGTGSVGPGAGGVTSANVPIQGTEAEFLAARPEFGQATSEALSGMPTPGTTLGQAVAAPTQTQIAAREALAYNPLSNPEVGGIENLGSPFEIQAVSPDNAAAAAKQGFLGRNIPTEYQKYIADPLLNASGTTLAAGTVLGGSLIAGQQERAAYAAQQAAINREREDKKKRYADLAARLQQQYPFQYAKGGVASLAGGGMTYMEAGGTTGPTGAPRDVTGTGDGMSDSVPASIEGVQEARLADGEFVIPADVVADIGNGSSDAGSKKLYDMMDRIRKARHGTTEQPPEIKAERLMPA